MELRSSNWSQGEKEEREEDKILEIANRLLIGMPSREVSYQGVARKVSPGRSWGPSSE